MPGCKGSSGRFGFVEMWNDSLGLGGWKWAFYGHFLVLIWIIDSRRNGRNK